MESLRKRSKTSVAGRSRGLETSMVTWMGGGDEPVLWLVSTTVASPATSGGITVEKRCNDGLAGSTLMTPGISNCLPFTCDVQVATLPFKEIALKPLPSTVMVVPGGPCKPATAALA